MGMGVGLKNAGDPSQEKVIRARKKKSLRVSDRTYLRGKNYAIKWTYSRAEGRLKNMVGCFGGREAVNVSGRSITRGQAELRSRGIQGEL